MFETAVSPENPLWEMENVIVTPHTSGSTDHYNQRVIENILIPNLKEYLSGKIPSINLLIFQKDINTGVQKLLQKQNRETLLQSPSPKSIIF